MYLYVKDPLKSKYQLFINRREKVGIKNLKNSKALIDYSLLIIDYLFISQSYFKVPKTIRLYATHYFIMKISNKRELQQIASNHSSDIDFKNFMKLYKDYNKRPYSFLVNDTSLSLDNPLRFGKNLL